MSNSLLSNSTASNGNFPGDLGDLQSLCPTHCYQIQPHLTEIFLGSDQFLLPICAVLQLDRQVIHDSEKLLQIYQDTKALIVGDPKGLAGATVYLITNRMRNPRSQGQVAKAAGISGFTLRLRIKGLNNFLPVSLSETDTRS